jgi:hypothetical protein
MPVNSDEEFESYLSQVKNWLLEKKEDLKKGGIPCKELDDSLTYIDKMLRNLPQALDDAYELLDQKESGLQQSRW